MTLWRTLLLATLACLLAACGDGGSCGLTRVAEVPLGTYTGRPTVPLEANGHTISFVLDTGAMLTSTLEFARRDFGLPLVEGGAYGSLGVGGPSVGRVGTMKGVRLGGLPLPERQIHIPSDREAGVSTPIGGLLGMDMIGRYDVDLDFPAGRLRLFDGRPCTDAEIPLPAPLVNLRAQWITQPSLNDLDNRPYIAGRLNGQRVVGLLDSGSSVTVLYSDVTAQLGFTDAALSRSPAGLVRGVGATHVPYRTIRPEAVEVGGVTSRAPELVVLPRAYTNDTQMIFGTDLLGKRRIWISMRRHAIYVGPPAGR